MLNVGFAGALLATGELSGVEGRLDDADRQVMSLTSDDGAASSARVAEIAFVDEDELRRVPGHIEMYRAALAQVRGDVPATVEHARRALELALKDDHMVRAGAPAFWASPSGPEATSERLIGHGASASRGSSGRDTSRTHLGPPSPLVTSP